jgi:triacylglycerol lipase
MVEANDDLRLPPYARMHIVLIPGFGGFDALGQLEYYAGVTALFLHWRDRHKDRATVVLHYFDNFPTAAVVTRATRLRQYLVKRIVRGEFAPDDRIALVGHSTGGLDIRRLLWDLAEFPETVRVDGGNEKDRQAQVKSGDLLHPIRRVVFLSVPQWGTNIADWVRDHKIERKIVVTELRAGVEASQWPLLDTMQRLVTSGAAAFANTDLLYAIQDSLREAEADIPRNAIRTAEAQEAASLLDLWLRHMATDFRAIDDLSVPDLKAIDDETAHREGNDVSPAHFTEKNRQEEREIWKTQHINVCSYATCGNNPFNFGKGAVPTWELLKPWTCPEWNLDKDRAAGTDIVYRTCYRACAGGPFEYPPDPDVRSALHLQSEKPQRITVWDNDGIVNTASMLWPNGAATRLVDADHMDVVGHYRRVPPVEPSDRKFQTYDLLKSNSRFGQPTFDAVWKGVFDFCVPMKAGKKKAVAA